MAEPAPRDRTQLVQEALTRAGLTLQRQGPATWRTSIDTWGEELVLVIRLSQHWLELTLDPFLDLPPDEPIPDPLRTELLRLNRDLRLMKFGISSSGSVVLTAELLTEQVDQHELQAVLSALIATIEEHRPRLGMLGRPSLAG